VNKKEVGYREVVTCNLSQKEVVFYLLSKFPAKILDFFLDTELRTWSSLGYTSLVSSLPLQLFSPPPF